MKVTNWLPAAVLVALGVGLAAVRPAVAASARMLSVQRAEYQKTSTFCWAASSVTVLNMLNPMGVTAHGRRITQEELAAYAQARYEREDMYPGLETGNFFPKMEKLHEMLLPKPPAQGAMPSERFRVLKKWRDICANPLDCSGTYNPILFNHEFEDTVGRQPLSWNEVRREIDAGRPILFGWNTEDESVNRPMGVHYSVVVGYSLTNGRCKVHILDPWVPLDADDDRRPVPAVNTPKAVDYSMFCSPTNVMGVGASHEIDRFNIRPRNASVAPLPRASAVVPADRSCRCSNVLVPPMLRIVDTRPPDLADFQRAFGDESSLRRTLEGADLPAPGDARKLGRAFPILALTSRELLETKGDVKNLLQPTVDAVLIPVEERGRVVDSILVLPEGRGWKPGGYANDRVTARLVAARRSFGPKIARDESQVFVVSIPSRDAFFIGGGAGEAAVLVPAVAESPKGSRSDRPEFARDLLGRVSAEIEIDSKRRAASYRGKVRPKSETL